MQSLNVMGLISALQHLSEPFCCTDPGTMQMASQVSQFGAGFSTQEVGWPVWAGVLTGPAGVTVPVCHPGARCKGCSPGMTRHGLSIPGAAAQ